MLAPASTSDLAALITRASSTGSPVRIVGGGTWLDAARPCRGESLHVSALRGVVQYEPGDLTLTARAGTTLQELAECTAAAGQWLALDPVAQPGATIGATIATSSDGPLASAFGRVRDLVLGLECVLGSGAIARAGGRVVKNVAGFDLVRLHTGAWGTLGVITEVTLRLRARPEVDRTFGIYLDERDSLDRRLAPLADAALAPLALELLNASLSHAVGLEKQRCLLIRLGGNAERVAAQAVVLQTLGDVCEVGDAPFQRLTVVEPAQALVARVTHERTRFTETWRHVESFAAVHGLWEPQLRGSLRRGLVRACLPVSAPDALPIADWPAFVRTLAPHGAHVTWERLPAQAWPHVSSAVSDTLSVRLRQALDPSGILNRGLLGEPSANVKSDPLSRRA